MVRRRDDGVLDMMVPPTRSAEMVAIDRRDVQAGDPGRRKSLSVAGIRQGVRFAEGREKTPHAFVGQHTEHVQHQPAARRRR